MPAVKSERELAIDMRQALERLQEAKQEKDNAQAAYDTAEHALLEWLEAEEKTMIEYENIGKFSVKKPQLYASCKVENMDSLFGYLEKESRTDLIKTSVNARSLSTFVKEQVLDGVEIPEFINIWYKKGVKLS